MRLLVNAARGTHAGACGRHARRRTTVDCDDSDGVFLLGTWTSASYHLYMMAPLEHMAFLQKQANAAQFTTAASLRKSTKLPVITAAEIAAASLEATAERAVTNDFGLGPDIYSDSDDDTDEDMRGAWNQASQLVLASLPHCLERACEACPLGAAFHVLFDLGLAGHVGSASSEDAAKVLITLLSSERLVDDGQRARVEAEWLGEGKRGLTLT